MPKLEWLLLAWNLPTIAAVICSAIVACLRPGDTWIAFFVLAIILFVCRGDLRFTTDAKGRES